MIKVIAFDYGGVIKLYKNDLFGDISNYLKIDKEEWMQEYFKIEDRFNGKDKGFEDIIFSLTSKFNNSEKAKDFVRKLLKNSSGKSYINTELINIIKKLKDVGYKTPLLSNNSSTLRDELIKDNLFDLFDEIVISGEEGCQKPEPEIFHILFNKLGVKPEEVIFIDNTQEEFKYADEIGYLPILFKDNKTLKNELSNLLEIELK